MLLVITFEILRDKYPMDETLDARILSKNFTSGLP